SQGFLLSDRPLLPQRDSANGFISGLNKRS
ncbi:MAG: hypothetical protein ACI9JE_001573, partial [Candidatus Krumholzibacteriia bacterium]